jgi:hypothetical protein
MDLFEKDVKSLYFPDLQAIRASKRELFPLCQYE